MGLDVGVLEEVLRCGEVEHGEGSWVVEAARDQPLDGLVDGEGVAVGDAL